MLSGGTGVQPREALLLPLSPLFLSVNLILFVLDPLVA